MEAEKNYKVSVELSALRGAKVYRDATTGKVMLNVDVEEADLFVADNGKVWLSLDMWAKRDGVDQYGKTHGVKFALSKDRGSVMTKEQKIALPFCGSAKPFETRHKTADIPVQRGNNEMPF